MRVSRGDLRGRQLSVRQIYKSLSTPNKHTICRTETGIKLEFILLSFFLLSSRLVKQNKKNKKNKKTAAQVLSSRKAAREAWEQEGLRLIAARRWTWSTSLLVFVAKDFGLAASFLDFSFLAVLVSSRPTVRAHTVRCASRSTVRLSKGLRASCITFFRQKKKKKKPIGQSKNPRTVSLEEKDSCRTYMRQENWRGDKR